MMIMAFGIKRKELEAWKQEVLAGNIAFLTHYWLDPRFPNIKTVTKVGCSDLERLTTWCIQYELPPQHIHKRFLFPHFDLIGPKQIDILLEEGYREQLERFKLI